MTDKENKGYADKFARFMEAAAEEGPAGGPVLQTKPLAEIEPPPGFERRFAPYGTRCAGCGCLIRMGFLYHFNPAGEMGKRSLHPGCVPKS